MSQYRSPHNASHVPTGNYLCLILHVIRNETVKFYRNELLQTLS